MSTLIGVFGFLLVFALVILGFHLLAPYLYSYKLTDNGIAFVCFGKIVMTVDYTEIESVELISWRDTIVRSDLRWQPLRLGNRVFTREMVLLRRRSKVVSSIVLTPPSAATFAQNVRTRMRDG